MLRHLLPSRQFRRRFRGRSRRGNASPNKRGDADRSGKIVNGKTESDRLGANSASDPSKLASKPNLGEKVAGDEVGADVDESVINGTTKVEAIVAVPAVAVASKIANSNVNRSANVGQRRKCWKRAPNQRHLLNRSKSRRP